MLSALLAIVQSWIPTVVSALAAVAVKGTLLLTLAALAALVLRKSSSATRHAVWCVALTGMLPPGLSWANFSPSGPPGSAERVRRLGWMEIP